MTAAVDAQTPPTPARSIRTPTGTSNALIASNERQQEINLAFATQLGDVKGEIGGLRVEQKSGFDQVTASLSGVQRSLVTSIGELRAEQSKAAEADKLRADEARGRDETANSTLTDIKTFMGSQLDLLRAEAERKRENDKLKNSRIDEFLRRFMWPLMALILAATAAYLGLR